MRLDKLKRMLAARERLPQGNWGENCAAIRAEIARLEARLAAIGELQK
jgi:hypothetical protein